MISDESAEKVAYNVLFNIVTVPVKTQYRISIHATHKMSLDDT